MVEAPPRLRTRKGQEQQFRDTSSDPEALRRRQATANRTLTILKGALNHAWSENKVATRDAWQRVKPFKEVDVARVGYLEMDQITRLVNACDPGFRPIVQAALLTGCRYGELAALRAADFNPDKGGTVHVRQSKAGKSRHVVLTDEGRRFFDAATAGREGNDLILPRPDGDPWARTQQQRPMREAPDASCGMRVAQRKARRSGPVPRRLPPVFRPVAMTTSFLL
jgi:integrase